MNLDELWIGEKLKIISSGRIGTFVGVSNQKARVKVGEKIYLVSANNIAIWEEPPLDRLVEEGIVESSLIEKKLQFDPVIDLHYEKLQDTRFSMDERTILDFQLRKLHSFLEKAIELRVEKITIIHGKGKGILRNEVLHAIHNIQFTKSIFPIHDQGGIEIMIRY